VAQQVNQWRNGAIACVDQGIGGNSARQPIWITQVLNELREMRLHGQRLARGQLPQCFERHQAQRNIIVV
jgi:hypothetical protein